MAVALALLPLSDIFCRLASLFVSAALAEFLGGKPLPALSTLVVEGQAHSLETFFGIIALTVVLGGAAVWLFRVPEANPWRATGQVCITALAAVIACSLCAVTLLAGCLPFLAIITSML